MIKSLLLGLKVGGVMASLFGTAGPTTIKDFLKVKFFHTWDSYKNNGRGEYRLGEVLLIGFVAILLKWKSQKIIEFIEVEVLN